MEAPAEKPKGKRALVVNRVLFVNDHPVLSVDLDPEHNVRAADADAYVMAEKVSAINAAKKSGSEPPIFREVLRTAKLVPGDNGDGHEVTEVDYVPEGPKKGKAGNG